VSTIEHRTSRRPANHSNDEKTLRCERSGASTRSAREGSVQTILTRMSSAVLTRSDLKALTTGRSYYPTVKLSVLEAVGPRFSEPKNPQSAASVFASPSAAAVQGNREGQDGDVDASDCSGSIQGGARESVSDYSLSP
jgi:hypothetical protein